MMKILLICSPILMIWLTGCDSQKPVILYPLTGDHIINVAADEEFTAPRDGYFLSDDYMQKVLKAKVKEF